MPPVTFASPQDFKRAAAATRAIERTGKILGAGQLPAVPVGNSHAQAVFRCAAAYDAAAAGWPGFLTYRNFNAASPSDDWIDGEGVYAEDINAADLEIGRRYECHVYGTKNWPPGTPTTTSVFVVVDVSTGGGPAGSPCGVGPSWLGGLKTTHCLKLTVLEAVGECLCVDADQVFYLTYDETADAWIPDEDAYDPYTFAACTGSFRVRFKPNPCGPPCLSLTTTDGGSGGETTYNLQFGCAGDQYATFGGGGPALCDGTEAAAGPKNNRFLVKVEWGCTVIENLACPIDAPPVLQTLPRTLYQEFENTVGGNWCDYHYVNLVGQVIPLAYNAAASAGGPVVYASNADANAEGTFTQGWGCNPLTLASWWGAGHILADSIYFKRANQFTRLDPYYSEIELVAQNIAAGSYTNCSNMPGVGGTPASAGTYHGFLKVRISETPGLVRANCIPTSSDQLLLRVLGGAAAGDHVGTYDAADAWWNFGKVFSPSNDCVVYYIPAVQGVVGSSDGTGWSWAFASGIPAAFALNTGTNDCDGPDGFKANFIDLSNTPPGLFGGKHARITVYTP